MLGIEIRKNICRHKPSPSTTTRKFEDDIKISKGNQYCIRYYLYKSKSTKVPSKIKDTFKKNESISCFASLLNDLKDNSKTYNRLLYILDERRNDISCVDYDTRVLWINESIKNNALPSYIVESDIQNNKYIIRLDEKNLSPSLLYTYLTVIRVMNEEPIFVKNTITLITKYQLPYCLAWLFASKISHSNAGHNIIPICKSYSNITTQTNINIISGIYLRYPLALKKYLSNPYLYDKRDIFSGGGFNIHGTLSKSFLEFNVQSPEVDNYPFVVKSTDLLTDTIIKLMGVNNEEEIKSFLKELKK